LKEYFFKSLSKILRLKVSDDGLKIVASYLQTDSDDNLEVLSPGVRVGEFDNQGSSYSWTWAWTTDNASFEIWKPSGIYLKLESTGEITLFRKRGQSLKTPKELWLGKTGLISYGIIAGNFDGSKVSLVKDSYPFWDAYMNVTYDGICEDEDFYPLRMMGRELSKRLRIPFDESIRV
tara:strand:- start:17841 stop:18371 length:531 start_codon:yes stop_codon:yes gene_type:complete